MQFGKCTAVLFTVLVMVILFTGCFSETVNKNIISQNTVVSTELEDTEGAQINMADVCAIIKSYTADELGLTGSLADYSVVVSSCGVMIEDVKYIAAAAVEVEECSRENCLKFDEAGRFLVSYDGKTVLIYNSRKKTAVPVEVIHEIPFD